MNWQEIMEQIAEIDELQQDFSIKLNNPAILEIISRFEKYCNNKKLDLKSLNNAILEHKIMITPYQIIILEKIMSPIPDLNLQSIYANMSEKKEEVTKYVIELKKEYELANKSIDLVIDLETITSMEYEINNDFQNTEYAKKVGSQTDYFEKEWTNFPNIPAEMWKNTLIERLKKYLNELSRESKQDLFVETFALSYDRNLFEFLNKEKLMMRIIRTIKSNKLDIFSLEHIYNKYRECLTQIEISLLNKMSLQEMYDEFKIIYETDFFKQKVNKF